MKIILSIEALSPQLTGIGRYVWELVSRLPAHAELDKVRFYHNKRWLDDPASLLQVVATPKPALIGKRKKKLRIKLPHWAKTAYLHWQCKGQLFHGPNFFIPACADIGIATVHDLSVFKFPETHPLDRIKQFEREFNRSMAQASHLITDSHATRLELIEYLGCNADKVTAVPLGVDNRFAPCAVTDPLLNNRLGALDLRPRCYSLCVSTLEPRKKIDRLLTAYQALPIALRTAYPLVIVGSTGWLSDALQKIIQTATQQGWVRYLGYVTEQDLVLLYSGAKLFIYPSSYEGFGLPVLEAMASGVPVICANYTSLPEVTQDAAMLIDPDDIDAFTTAINRGLCDTEWWENASFQGIKQAQRFNWDTCINQTLAVYKKL